MTAKHLITALIVAWALPGCTWLREGSSWRKKDVPVTPPTRVAPALGDVTDQVEPPATSIRGEGEPESKPAPVPLESKIKPDTPTEGEPAGEQAAIAPKSESRPSTPQPETRPLPKRPTPPPIEPPPPQVQPTRIEKPTMLENLVPGTNPIGDIERLDALQPEPARPPAPEAPTVPPSTPPQKSLPPAKPIPQTTRAADKPRVAPPAEAIKLPIKLPPPHPRRKISPADKIEYGKPEIVAASLIQVNDRFLTVDDVLRAAGEALHRIPETARESTFRQQADRILREQIQTKVIDLLVYAEAGKVLTDQQKQMIENDLNRTLETLIAEVGGSRKKLDALLAERGTDVETVLSDERRRLTVRGFLQLRFYPAITINRRMLWDYYRKHPSEFSAPRKVQMQIIAARTGSFLPVGVGEASEAERRLAAARAGQVIADAAAALRSGEEFAKVARRLSRGIKAVEGGIWPMMAAGNFRETAVEQIAFAMDEGQISDVIETDTGYYIVKALKVRTGRTITFEDAQEQIENKLREEQFSKLQRDYFRELMENAHVRQSEEFLRLAVDRAVKEYRQP